MDTDLDAAPSWRALLPLLSTIGTTFAAIAAGGGMQYVGVLSKSSTELMNSALLYISMPALLFRTIAQLALEHIQWKVLLVMLLSKMVVFTLVVAAPVVLGREFENSLLAGGMFAVVATQGNYLALGYPFIRTIFPPVVDKATQVKVEDYSQYCFVAAPMQLGVVNVVAILIMTYAKRDRGAAETSRQLFSLLVASVSNPVVSVVLLGLGWNLYGPNLPSGLDALCRGLGALFGPGALFLLGASAVDQSGTFALTGKVFMWGSFLMLCKLLVLPAVARLISEELVSNDNIDAGRRFVDFNFMLGAMPAAPGIPFMLSQQFGAEFQIVASSMVWMLVLAGPMLFFASVLINVRDHFTVLAVYNLYSLVLLAISIPCGLVLLWEFCTDERLRRYPTSLIAGVVACSLVRSTLLMTGCFPQPRSQRWNHHAFVFVFCWIQCATKVLTLTLAAMTVHTQCAGGTRHQKLMDRGCLDKLTSPRWVGNFICAPRFMLVVVIGISSPYAAAVYLTKLPVLKGQGSVCWREYGAWEWWIRIVLLLLTMIVGLALGSLMMQERMNRLTGRMLSCKAPCGHSSEDFRKCASPSRDEPIESNAESCMLIPRRAHFDSRTTDDIDLVMGMLASCMMVTLGEAILTLEVHSSRSRKHGLAGTGLLLVFLGRTFVDSHGLVMFGVLLKCAGLRMGISNYLSSSRGEGDIIG